ncbi:MAG: SUMF1/EgtB/PvdO family nonheme iron enzyme [candidate division KSB1 bacterium]|nr:SUMF1/EgtB/PvdO family nonheme iron enzyme [candidate division KSB1 bacterium]MDZ7368713.1 SUMF1/EgtB/PvdO family nonheme iron enzyme [candidate division KSB1 bacterium]MDZ7406546.1 SUMF1/EgtB/PvdO family nonheme iron enzyme [candidate division KSB1 bacterium]
MKFETLWPKDNIRQLFDGQALIVRVLRGGAWNNNPHNVACANRNNNEPDNRNNNVGFRVAKTPSKGQRANGKKSPGPFSRNLAAHGLPERGTMGVHSACPVSRLSSVAKNKIARRRLVVARNAPRTPAPGIFTFVVAPSGRSVCEINTRS